MTAFGGPAMVAYIKEMSVNRHQWIDEETFKDGVALCQSIPGATAMQTAAYVGFRSKGIPGALASFVGFGLPAFIFMLVLSALYAKYHSVPKIISLFNGLQVIIVAIVAHASFSFGRTTFKNRRDVVLAITASVLFWAGVSPFLILIGAALAGTIFLRNDTIASASLSDKGTGAYHAKRLAVLVSAPLLGLLALLLAAPRLFTLSALMMKIDVFAFGGGLASLPLMV